VCLQGIQESYIPLVADITNQDPAKSLDFFKVMETKPSLRQLNRAWKKQVTEETYGDSLLN